MQTAILDVTNPAHMVALVARLPQLTGDAGFYGLVNNAGVVVAGPTESMTTAEWQRQYAINLFGPIALTTAMIPFLRQARGRMPRTRYLVGTDAKVQALMKWLMPDRMLDSFLIRVLALK